MSDKLKLMLLDDEVEILNSLKRLLRKEFDIHTYSDPNLALGALAQESFALIISDMRMPVMDGATFLTQAKDVSPNSVRLLLTGYSDLESTSRAINEGNIFSYISKPWDNTELKQILNRASEHYQLKVENQKLTKQLMLSNRQLSDLNEQLENKVKQRTSALKNSNEKLKTSVESQRSMFQQLLHLISLIIEQRTHDTIGHNERVALHCKLLAEHFRLKRNQVINIYIAALVHDLGKIALDDALLNVPENQLEPQQWTEYKEHAQKGAELLSTLPKMENIAKTIKHQYEHQDGTGVPEHLSAENIPFGAKLIRLVVDHDRLVSGLTTGVNLPPEDAMNYITKLSGKVYDPNAVKAYKKLLTNMPKHNEQVMDYCIATDDLEEGMCISKDIINKAGGVMLTQNTTLSNIVIEKLKDYEQEKDFRLAIYVY